MTGMQSENSEMGYRWKYRCCLDATTFDMSRGSHWRTTNEKSTKGPEQQGPRSNMSESYRVNFPNPRSRIHSANRSEPNSHRSGPRTAFGGCPSISTRLYYSTRLNYSPIAMHIRIFIWWGISDLGTKSSYTSCISSSKMLANGQ